MTQTLIVAACIVAATGYAAWRIYDAFRKSQDPCYGCKGCELKKQVCEKKTCEKFGQSK
ncbi:MAG: FeoB-associated Cys-rich membrane protein [Prevotella sp.]|nr:FeoB-associated Cys-rich membrane protein [Prevotella sp.]